MTLQKIFFQQQYRYAPSAKLTTSERKVRLQDYSRFNEVVKKRTSQSKMAIKSTKLRLDIACPLLI